MDIEAAQNQAKQKLQDAQKKIDEAEKAAGECNNKIKAIEAEADSLNQDLLKSVNEKQKIIDQSMQQIQKIMNQKQELMNQNINLFAEQKDINGRPWFSDNDEKRSNEIDNITTNNVKQYGALQRQIDQIRDTMPQLTDEEQAEIDKQNDINERADALRNGECADAIAAIDKAKAEKDALGYNEDDIDAFAEAAKSLNSKANKYNVGRIRAEKDSESRQIMDLRNLPGGINFRSNQKAMKVSIAASSEDNNVTLSPSKSYYMNQDYLFTNSLASPVPLGKVNCDSLPEVQTLIINEFQPYDMLSVADLLPGAVNLLVDVALSVTNMAGGFIVNAAKTAIINNSIDECSKNPSELYNSKTRERTYFTSDPVQQVENMFNGGKWLNTYEIPFYGKDYLKGQAGNWEVGGAKESYGSIGGVMQAMGIDFPSNPKFKIDMKSAADRKISTEFYLINCNDNWLERNFQFLNAIYAGTTWLHMKYCLLRPTNIYHVLCPGRFQMMWASMKSEVTFEGKLRKNVNVSKKLAGMGIKSIDEDMLWPDAWKIKLDIQDFTPNNFNMYAEYYMNGFNGDEVQSLAEQITMDKMLSDLGNYMSKMKADIVDAGSKLIGDVKETANNVIKNVQGTLSDMTGKEASTGNGGNQ